MLSDGRAGEVGFPKPLGAQKIMSEFCVSNIDLFILLIWVLL